MLVHFQDYNDVVGDHPLNMGTTTLAFNAYALTGERRYLDWLVGYMDAWVDRTEANGGITPSNVGLDGTIGGACGGRWYGGVYGWGFSVYNPATGKIQHRPAMMGRAPWSFGNGPADNRRLPVRRHLAGRHRCGQREREGGGRS